jgi:hypothetical protein
MAFSATSAVLIGVFLHLLAAGRPRAAEAWARAHSSFVGYGSRLEHRPGVYLAITPMSEADASLLEAVRGVIDDAIRLFAGDKPSSLPRDGSTLALEILTPAGHPNTAWRQWWTDLTANVEASMAVRTGPDRAVLDQFRELMEVAKVGAAATFMQSGPLPLYTVSGLQPERQDELHDLIWEANRILWDDRKRVGSRAAGVDRLSRAVAMVSTKELVQAGWNNSNDPKEIPVVGAIVPGGTAAPGDVTSILEQAEGIVLRLAVVQRGSATIKRDMVRALDGLRDANPVAIVIGYGGTNTGGVLDAVVDALMPELHRPAVPMYLGIGHNDFRASGGGAGVRWCKTPLAAALLFCEEALGIPRERLTLLDRASRDLRSAIAEPDKLAEIARLLGNDLTALDARLEEAKKRYLQERTVREV